MKLFKLFLVVAIATLGLSSIANAKSLSEAIAGTDISGKFSYKVESKTKDNTAVDKEGKALTGDAKAQSDAQRKFDEEADHTIDLDVKLKIPVSDSAKVVIGFEEAGNEDFKVGQSGAQDDKKSDIKYVQMNTLYLQEKPSEAMTVSYGMFDQHEGVKIAQNLGMLTVGGHYFFNTDKGVNNEMGIALTKIKAGPAKISFKYLAATDADKKTKSAGERSDINVSSNTKDTDEGWSKMKLAVNVPLGALAVSVKHLAKTINKKGVKLNGKTEDTTSGSETALKVGYKANGVKAHLTYMMIGTLGGISDGDMGIDTDGTYDIFDTTSQALAGGSAMQIGVGYAVAGLTPSLTYTVKSLGSDFKDSVYAKGLKGDAKKTDDTDLKLALARKVGKVGVSFYYVKSSGYSKAKADTTMGMNAAYKF